MKPLSLQHKQSTRVQLRPCVERHPGQSGAVPSPGVSAGTIDAALNGRFDPLSDEKLLRIRSQVATAGGADWKLCETTAFCELTTLLEDAQANQNVSWVVGSAGIGKSTAARDYAARHENTFVICCSEDMRRGDFIREMARVTGTRLTQTSLREKLRTLTDALGALDRPLLIFDEGDKLMDAIFHYFISIYNALEGRCGIIFLSTAYIKRRMNIGLEYNRKGYDELYSRIGRRFIDLTPPSRHEVQAVCAANGVIAQGAVAQVVKDAQTAVSVAANPWERRPVQEYYDMRRVRKSVHKSKKLAQISDQSASDNPEMQFK